MSSSRRPTLLLIEASPEFQKLLQRAVTAEGYVVVIVPNFKIALTVASELSPDVVVTDLELTDMDFPDFVGEFRALPGGAATPIILHSGAFDLDRIARELDIDGCVQKGELNTLLETIWRLTPWTHTPTSLDWTSDSDEFPVHAHQDWTGDRLSGEDPLRFACSERIYGHVLHGDRSPRPAAGPARVLRRIV